MNKEKFKGWEIIKLLTEKKLRDNTIVKRIQTREDLFSLAYVENNSLYRRRKDIFSININEITKFDDDFEIKEPKEHNLTTLLEAVKKKKLLRLNEEYSDIIKEEFNLLKKESLEEHINNIIAEEYIKGKYLRLSDMLTLIGSLLDEADCKKVLEEKLWYVEGE